MRQGIVICAKQALKVDLVPYLLKLLEGVGLETQENPSAIKAQIVKALKSMTRSLQFGEQVCMIKKRDEQNSASVDEITLNRLFVGE